MLNMATFEEGLEWLENTYISKKFGVKHNDAQYRQWYKLLKGLTDEAYLNSVDEWCASHSTLPSPSDILEIANRLRPHDNTVAIPKNEKHCTACGNRGVICQIEHNNYMDRDYEVMYACVCNAGEYYRNLGYFKTITKEDWNKSKIHKTFTPRNEEPKQAEINVKRFIERFKMF